MRLFKTFDSFTIQEDHKRRIRSEASALSEQQLNGTSLDEWIAYFENKYSLDVPSILHDSIDVEIVDAKVDARNFRSRFDFIDQHGPVLVDGNRITIHVPYTGDRDLFNCSGTSIYHNSLDAEIDDQELRIIFYEIEQDGDKLNTKVQSSVSLIDQFLNGMRGSFLSFNSSIRSIVEECLEKRLEKFKKDQEMKSKIKFNIRSRAGAASTYKVPEVRRRVAVSRPSPKTSGQVTAEPVLDEAEFDQILTIMRNMALVMEKSPRAFSNMGEEDLRQHFLVQLNGQYEGNATGETFNFEGKTDILIKSEGKTVFIAECKYWSGPKTITSTIDQILGYTSWRDTKTAIVIFNKNKNLTQVLSQIPSLAQGHRQFDKMLSLGSGHSETEFRFLFKHPDDPDRKLKIAILVFDVPH